MGIVYLSNCVCFHPFKVNDRFIFMHEITFCHFYIMNSPAFFLGGILNSLNSSDSSISTGLLYASGFAACEIGRVVFFAYQVFPFSLIIF